MSIISDKIRYKHFSHAYFDYLDLSKQQNFTHLIGIFYLLEETIMKKTYLPFVLGFIGAILSGCATTTPPSELPSAEKLVTQAQSAFSEGNKAKAISLYEQATKLNPTDKTAWHKLARLYYDEKSYILALQAANEGLERTDKTVDSDALLELRAISLVSSLKIGSKIIQDIRLVEFQNRPDARREAESMAKLLQKALGNDNKSANDSTKKTDDRKSDPTSKPVHVIKPKPAVPKTSSPAPASTASTASSGSTSTPAAVPVKTGGKNPFGGL